MKGKMRKIVRGCSALTLVALMPLAGATMASAEDTDKVVTGTELAPAEAAITKVLRVAQGVKLPANGINYKFTVAPVKFEGSADTTFPAPGSNGEVVVNISETSSSATATGPGDADVYKAQSQSLFSSTGAFSGKTWPKAGVYEYKVTEATPADWVASQVGTEDLSYSSAEYKLVVYVENGQNSGDLYVSAITATRLTADDGTQDGEKVDPGAGNGTNLFSGLAFTNEYGMTTNPTLPPDSSSGYDASVTKLVAGARADQTKYFDFAVTLTVPPVNGYSSQTYKAYVVNAATGAVETAAANAGDKASVVPGDAGGDPNAHFVFAPGSVKNIKLKHNQSLAFVGLPYASSLSVTEAATPNYRATPITSTGQTPDAANAQPAACGENTACTATLAPVGASAKDLTYTNTRTDNAGETPTGLDLNDAAYWAMIVLAGAAMIGFVVLRVRKSKRAAA